MATIQVRKFYAVAKEIGLKRGEFSCTAQTDKFGEYDGIRIVIFTRLSESQCHELAKKYCVHVYIRNGKTRWDLPYVSDSDVGLHIVNLDKE